MSCLTTSAHLKMEVLPPVRQALNEAAVHPRELPVFSLRALPDSRSYYLTGMLITIAPMTSLILKSRLGLS